MERKLARLRHDFAGKSCVATKISKSSGSLRNLPENSLVLDLDESDAPQLPGADSKKWDYLLFAAASGKMLLSPIEPKSSIRDNYFLAQLQAGMDLGGSMLSECPTTQIRPFPICVYGKRVRKAISLEKNYIRFRGRKDVPIKIMRSQGDLQAALHQKGV